MLKTTIKIVPLALALLAADIATAQQPRLRDHRETEAEDVDLLRATQTAGTSEVSFTQSGNTIKITGNGIPDHLVGRFPNRGNPNRISEQNISYSIPASPKIARRVTDLELGWSFGISLHGILFDPLAAEFWRGDRRSGWSYNALGGAISLGLDENHAHVQPTGKYHYHGIPTKLVELLDWSASKHSPLIGYAADGFPIYAVNGSVNGNVQTMTSSYRLKSGNRPGGSKPTGDYDGAFNEDYQYVEGAGSLDQCNGAYTVSKEYPSGTYAYFLTEEFPMVPRCFLGSPDRSFKPRRP
jgi:hypothetical protein